MTQNKNMTRWLFVCAALLVLITLVGAITRLTESGLSIVEWKPVTGALPPTSEAAWSHEFSLYQTSPQYKKVNVGMSLDDFKKIYFWEWVHRLIGRLIGLAYALPLAFFWMREKIPAPAKAPLLGILGLGFLQGAMGWYMVSSGLVDQPAVSHYRLAAHLMLAVTIFCCLLRMGLALGVPRDEAGGDVRHLRPLVLGAVAIAATTMIWGAFVAGLRAGLIYNNDFPWMGAHLWPGEILHYEPWWKNFIENHAAVQFTHRVLAVLTFCTILTVATKGLFESASRGMNKVFFALWTMACVQVVLGIATLMSHVNVAIATLHQAGAMTVMGLLMLLLHHIPTEKARP
jgi:cytochrome c oxidase assembly protein subunit 15